MIYSCTNNSPTESLTWDVNYNIPLLKEKITVSMLGLGAKNVNDDTTRTGDTLFLSRQEQVYQQCKSEIFTVPEQSGEWYGGDLLIRKLKLESFISNKNITNLLPLKKSSGDDVPHKIIRRDTIVIPQINYIDFGQTSEVLSAVVKNQSLIASIKEVAYSIISSRDTLLFQPIAFLGPLDSVVIKASLDGFSTGDTVFLECSYMSDIVKQLADLQLSFTAAFDGLHFKKATINDSLLAFKFNYEKDISFGQAGFNASFVDISSFSLPFTINNTSPVGLTVTGRINSIWDAEYCKQNSIESADDIKDNEIDSAYFKGDEIVNIVVPRNRTGGNDDISNHVLHLKDARILPSWNKSDSINSLHLSICAEFIAEGKMIALENIASSGIQIGTPSINIRAINGFYTYERRINNPSEVIPVMSESPPSDITRSFRNRLVPDRTNLDIDIRFDIPDDTRFENVDLLCRLFEQDNNEVLDSMIFTMNDVAAGKKYKNEVSFNRIIERLPDSLRYSLTYIIKPYKKIYLDNDVIYRNYNNFSAVFNAHAEMKMTMYLVWGIIDTISFELERNSASFPLSSQNIELMKSKELDLSVQIFNNSNISGRLRAVQIDSNGVDGNESVYLLGKNGLILPTRGNEKDNFITFNEKDVRSLTEPDNLSVKWIIDLFPCKIDALRDDDYIEINADLSLKGQHSSSSMFGFR